MADSSNISKHTCPNICEKCQTQCRKWQEISDLEGSKLMKFIKTQQATARKEDGSPQRTSGFTDEGSITSIKPSSPSELKEDRAPNREFSRGTKYRPGANVTTRCQTCDTILQQISLLLCEIWDILDPQQTTCGQCRLDRHRKCICSQTGTYSSLPYSLHLSKQSFKGQYISWLTKLRHTLLAVLGVTKSTCKIYKCKPKDELEKLLQKLKFPLQKQARDIRITSLTKTCLSSTELDESLVASLIENTELLERVLAEIKVVGYKIEMNIREANDFQPQNSTGHLPGFKPYYNVVTAEKISTSSSSPSDNIIMFPSLSVKTKSEKKELKYGATESKDEDSKQKTKLDRGEFKVKQHSDDDMMIRDKGKGFPNVKFPTNSMKHLNVEREDEKSSAIYMTNDKRNALMEERKTKKKQHVEMDRTKNRREATTEELQNTKAISTKQHFDMRQRVSLPLETEPTRGDLFKRKGRVKGERNKEQPQLATEGKGTEHSGKSLEDNKSVKNTSTLERKSVANSKISGDENYLKKTKEKEIAKVEPLPSDRATNIRRQTIQVPSTIVLKHMQKQKVEELRTLKRAQRFINENTYKKIRSIKSLPNLERLKEKQRLMRRKSSQVPEESYTDIDVVKCKPDVKTLEMIRGNVVLPRQTLTTVKYDLDAKPLLFKVKADLVDDVYPKKDGGSFESVTTIGSQKTWLRQGITEYRLSNPKYIELGYTKLPSVSVMRKSIVYKMEQPHPDKDWFRQHIKDRILFYNTCEKLAEIDFDGHGRWYYKNGRVALDYCAADEKNVRNRYIVYSSGKSDANGNPRWDTVLACFDHLGNGIVYDHCGNVRLKYNQNEGEIFDKTIAPTGRWKWHSFNTSLQLLQNVYIEQQAELISQSQLDLMEEKTNQGNKAIADFEEMSEYKAEEYKHMLKIEINNFLKEKNQMQQQKYQPFQLKMKAFKLNEQFSLRIYEQGKIYLYFATGARSFKLNLGLTLITSEILGTEAVNLREILTPFDQNIPPSGSVGNILGIIREIRKKSRKKKCAR